jgi:hypothetical protein
MAFILKTAFIPKTASALGLLIALCSTAFAQVDLGNGGRSLAEGVLKVVPSALNARDTFSLPTQMPELVTKPYQPKMRSTKETLHGLAQRVVFFRDVWEYEFAFTGLRQANIAVGGSPQNVWYMVYRVRNLGKSLSFEEVKKNPEFEHLTKDLRKDISTAEQHFLPRLTLEGWVVDDISRKYSKAVYSDEINPAVAREIQEREDSRIPLFDAVQLSTASIKPVSGGPNSGVWGVAIWTGVNPKIDFVSVFVEGFTNAYRIERNGDEINLKRKNIQLNFWRAGDAVDEVADDIDFGIPLVDDPKQQVLITRRYDLPGPVLTVFEDDPNSNRDLLRAELDAMFNLQDFTSPLIPIMDKKRLPEKIATSLKAIGINVTAATAVEALIEGRKWTFQIDGKTFIIDLNYRFWEPQEEGIRFIKSLDSFWIYR